MLLWARQAQGVGDGHMSVVVSSGLGPNVGFCSCVPVDVLCGHAFHGGVLMSTEAGVGKTRKLAVSPAFPAEVCVAWRTFCLIKVDMWSGHGAPPRHNSKDLGNRE